MQYAYDDLEDAALGPDGRPKKILTTRAEEAEYTRRQTTRAESITRPQLELLIKQLRRQRETCVNQDVRESFSAALAPLEARLGRYHAAEEAERQRLAKKQVRRAPAPPPRPRIERRSCA
jgi:hypothetical protein